MKRREGMVGLVEVGALRLAARGAAENGEGTADDNRPEKDEAAGGKGSMGEGHRCQTWLWNDPMVTDQSIFRSFSRGDSTSKFGSGEALKPFSRPCKIPFRPLLVSIFTSARTMRPVLSSERPTKIVSDQAMEEADRLEWREDDTARVLFLLADAPPHDDRILRTVEAVEALRSRGVSIYPVAASGTAERAEFVLRAAALLTGAEYLFLTDDSGIGLPHAEPHIPFYHVQRLDHQMLRMIRAELRGCSDADVEACLREQGKTGGNGDSTPLGHLLIQKNLMTVAEFMEVLSIQGRGILICGRCGLTPSSRSGRRCGPPTFPIR